MRLRTLHITNNYHHSSGGIRTSLQAMLHAAEQYETPIRILTPSSENKIEDVGKFGRIYHIRAPHSPIIDRRYRLLTPNRIYSSKAEVWRIIEAEKPDLICIADKYTLPYLGGLIRKNWAPISFRPTVVGMSCERMDDNVRVHLPWMPFWKRLARLYLGFIYIPQFDAHIANSVYTAGELIDAMIEKHKRHVDISPLGVDAVTFHPQLRAERNRAVILDEMKLPQQIKLLAYVGRLSPEKNPMLLIRTLEELASFHDEDFRLLIVGSGPSRKLMEKEAGRTMSGKVVFYNHIQDRERLASLLANCDAFLHPNPREPFGIGPLEAMASRLPVVLPNQGGVLAYADDDNSWLASPDAASFSKAVRSIFKNPTIRENRTAAARRTAEQFSWQKAASRLFQCFEQLHSRRINTAGPSSESHLSANDASGRFGKFLLSAFFGLSHKKR